MEQTAGVVGAGGTSSGTVPQTRLQLPVSDGPTIGTRRRNAAARFRPTAARFIRPSLGIIVIELQRAPFRPIPEQEAAPSDLHTPTDV